MGTLNINQAQASDFTNTTDFDYSVPLKTTDGIAQQEETTYTNSNWAKQWGYFNEIPDLKAAITMKAIWNVGKGYNTDPETEALLDYIKGWGKDTFEEILFNMEIIKRVGGDAYAEIIREDEKIVNIKPLDPSSIRIVVDNKGMIKRYEQISKLGDKPSIIHKFEPREILHFSNNRLADQIHGISDIDALMKTLRADEEVFDDVIKVMHRQAKPMIMFKLGTDDATKIDTFVTKMDLALKRGENIYIPNDENSVSYEVIQAPPSPVLLQWIDTLRTKFYRTIGLPQVIASGSGQSTESESKVLYLAFEQIVEKEQRQIEKQLWNQLLIRINLIPPVSMQPPLAEDQMKDGNSFIQPSDTQAGVGR